MIKIVNEDMEVRLLDALGKGKGEVCVVRFHLLINGFPNVLFSVEESRRSRRSGEDSERRFRTLQALCSAEPSFMGHLRDSPSVNYKPH